MKWILQQDDVDYYTRILQTELKNQEIHLPEIVNAALVYLEEGGDVKRAEYPYSAKYVLLTPKTDMRIQKRKALRKAPQKNTILGRWRG
ncbi:MAG: hypothetical protein ABI970_12305 [Chloroflexota bacterium]